MKNLFSFLRAAVVAAALFPAAALAQSGCPTIINGAVLTAGQWNACFAAKQNTLGYVPINKAGDTMLGSFGTAPTTALKSGLNIPPGTAPTSPVNGDFWSTAVGFYGRVNGVTVGPFTNATSGSFSATTPLAVTFPSSVVNYALNYDSNFSVTGGNLALSTSGIALNSPTSGALGAGTINVSGGFYVNGAIVAPTSAGLTGQMLNGVTSSTPTWTYTPTLGASGTLGTLAFGNATSGTVKLQPTTGALGSAVLTIPAATDTIAVLAAVQALTNKSYNGLTLTSTTGTFTLTAAKTLAVTNSLTLSGTDSTTMTFPGATDAVMGLGAIQTVTAVKTFADGTLVLAGLTSGTLTQKAAAIAGTGTITWPAGTTNFSATGGTSNVLRQSSAGAAITVGQLAASDLSNGTSGSGAVVLTTGASMVTPALGAATATSLAVGGCTISTNALCVTGTTLFNSGVTFADAGQWTSSGIVNPLIVQVASSGSHGWNGRALIYSPADGIVELTNNAGTGFTRLQFGGTTSSFPAIRRTTTALNFRLADDTADAPITAAAGSFSAAITGTSASASSLAIGLNGATNPAFNVDSSTALQVAGLNVRGAVTGGTVAVSVIDSGTNANLSVDAKGSGTIILGGTSTGAITLNRATTMSAALTYGGVTLTNAVTGTGPMVLGASPTITGHATIEGITATGATGTGNFVFATAPSVSALTVTGSFTATGLVTLADHATQPANTVLLNGTSGAASPTAFAMSSCSGSANAVQWLTNTGFQCGTITAAASSITAGTTVVTGGPGVLQNASSGGTLVSSTTLPSSLTIPTPTVTGGTITALAALAIRDTSAAFDVTLAATSSTTLTAGRTLTFDVVNAARTIKLGANLTIASDPGAVTGALKSNGTGTFAQAAASDLSNGSSGSGAVCLVTSCAMVTPTLGAATATSVKTASIFPPSDSTTALQILKADGATRVVDFDTTNARVGINKTPGAFDLDVNGAINGGSTLNVATGYQIAAAAASGNYLRGNGTNFVSSAIQAGDLPLGSSSAFGAVKCDNVTITCAAGVITSSGSSATSVTVGTTSIVSGTTGYLLYNNAGTLGNQSIASALGSRATLPTTCIINTTSATTCANGETPANNGTYTTPANVLWLEVTLVGGGDGGAGSAGGAAAGGNPTCWNTTGAACTTPVYQAGGGAGAGGGAVSGSGTCNVLAVSGGGGGAVTTGISGSTQASGGTGGNSTLGGGASGSNGAGVSAPANTGGGGGGAGQSGANSANSGIGGGGGATCKTIIPSPAATYTYAVAGTAAGGTGTVFNGGTGAGGKLVVIAHYGS